MIDWFKEYSIKQLMNLVGFKKEAAIYRSDLENIVEQMRSGRMITEKGEVDVTRNSILWMLNQFVTGQSLFSEETVPGRREKTTATTKDLKWFVVHLQHIFDKLPGAEPFKDPFGVLPTQQEVEKKRKEYTERVGEAFRRSDFGFARRLLEEWGNEIPGNETETEAWIRAITGRQSNGNQK